MRFNELDQALRSVGQMLEEQDLHYEIVAIGGGCLLLLGLIDRPTVDLDVVALMQAQKLVTADPLPKPLVQAVEKIAAAMSIDTDWLNAGPTSQLRTGLPDGFMERLHKKVYGGLTVFLASRLDQIHFKLYACVDHGPRSKHFIDLVTLKPTEDELKKARAWCVTQDVSEGFRWKLDQAVEYYIEHHQ